MLVKGYYATIAQIRYYGQVPKAVGKTTDAVWATGIKSTVFGESTISADWRASLETAADQALDLSRRKEPAHEALANLTLNLESLVMFTRWWGFLDSEVDPVTGRSLTRLQHVKPFQELLQRAWGGDPTAISEMAKDVTARVDVSAKGVEIAIVDLCNLVRLLFLRDHAAAKAKVCKNPDCPSPYFLQQRKGQQFCTHQCAVLINVRRFRQRAAKRSSSKPKQQRRQIRNESSQRS